MADSYFSYKEGSEVEWIELNLFLYRRPLSKAQIITMAVDDDGFEKDEDYLESRIDGWLNALIIREPMYHKPVYTLANNLLRANYLWNEIPEYFLCLYYSVYGAGDRTTGTKIFEKISAYALKNFFGGEVRILGFPDNKNLNEYLDEIAITTGERRIQPANQDYKDDGVDVIGYKLFDDSRSGNMYILQQCAAGGNWNQKKSIKLSRWLTYVGWLADCIMLSMATVSYVEKREWEKRTSDYGILFDRVRIYNYLYSENVDPVLRAEVVAWCQTKIDAL